MGNTKKHDQKNNRIKRTINLGTQLEAVAN